MAATTKFLIAEQISVLLKGGDRSASTTMEMPVIIKLVEQLINQSLKVDYFNTHLAAGETIPDGLVLANYEKIAVEVYKKNYSRAKLPAIPISLPRNMGVFAVQPWVSNESLDSNTIAAVSLTNTSIYVTWSIITNATGYYLERATNEAFTANVTALYSGTASLFTDSNLTASTRYYYRVQGFATSYNDSAFVQADAVTGANARIHDNTHDLTHN